MNLKIEFEINWDNAKREKAPYFNCGLSILPMKHEEYNKLKI